MDKVHVNELLENSAKESGSSLVFSTNLAIERLFGSMKNIELTKFNMADETLSALNYMKCNYALSKITKKEHWESIFDQASAETEINHANIVAAATRSIFQRVTG